MLNNKIFSLILFYIILPYICIMIKKITAYSFLLIANIVLLAHVVLPHHHHEQQVCIERTHCVTDEHSHFDNTSAKDHQHDNNSHSTICVLKQAVVIPSSQAKHLNNYDNCSDNHNHNFYILSNFGYVDLQPISEAIASKSVSPSFYTTFVTPTLGLRAPPIV